MGTNKKILKRTYYTVKLVAESPIHVSNGDKEHTDSDVLKNKNKDYFIPGTSLAGAFRNYIEKDKKTKCIFGYSDGDKGNMSSVFISDLVFDAKHKLSVRDGVQLDEEKSVNNKFDMEILETGVDGNLYIEVVERDGVQEDLSIIICDLLWGINTGDIRFGANKNRGFGRMKVESVVERSFSAEQRKQWIDFLNGVQEKEESANERAVSSAKPFKAWIEEKEKTKQYITPSGKYVKFIIPLKQLGGISIRKYSTKPDEADYEHISCNGEPVIPGSSWNGAIRADARRILKEIGLSKSEIDTRIDLWFGCIKEEKKQDKNVNKESSEANDQKQSGNGNKKNEEGSHQSMIVFSESIIKGDYELLPMTRNKINRWSGATVESALYSEISCFNGKTELEFMIKKDKNEAEAYEALIGLMEIIVEDIRKGYVAIGGQTAVGRGIFEGNGEITKYEINDENTDFGKKLYEVTVATRGNV